VDKIRTQLILDIYSQKMDFQDFGYDYSYETSNRQTLYSQRILAKIISSEKSTVLKKYTEKYNKKTRV